MSRRSARGPGSLSPSQRRSLDTYLRRRGRQEFAMQSVPSRPSLILRWGPAILIALLAVLFAMPALGDDGGLVQPGAEEFLARGGLSALLIAIAVRFVRMVPRLSDGSDFAKRCTAAACVVFGVLLGWAGVAPAVAVGLAGKLLGGFGAGGLAYFGAAVLGSKGRLEDSQ